MDWNTLLEGAPAALREDTLCAAFQRTVAEEGDVVALRTKGNAVSITWREYGEKAKHVGLGLVGLGLRPRDVVSIIADNCPEWLYTDLGTMAVGGITAGIYTTDSAKQVEYIVNDSGTRFFFAENEEQLDKILEVRARCPELVRIFVYDMEGLHGFRDDQVMPFEALLELGARYERDHPEAFDMLVETA
jgi:long-chain acyl-CoA synthetase